LRLDCSGKLRKCSTVCFAICCKASSGLCELRPHLLHRLFCVGVKVCHNREKFFSL
jgi:hypothetical protein